MKKNKKEKAKIILKIGFILLILLFYFIVGWFANDFYRDYTNKRILDGLLIKGMSYSEAKKTAYKSDKYGDWILVNVNGMNYERMVETCKHEAGHELFAEYCENTDKCFEIAKELENETE